MIDAAQLDAPPGTIRTLTGAQMDRFVARPGGMSVHEVSLAELMDMARLGAGVPERRALIAIQPENVDWGDRPLAAVQAAIPRAVDTVLELLAAWSP